MERLRELRTVRILITALYALSMAVLGFAHISAPSAFSAERLDLSSYALPDGSLPEVCLSGQGSKAPHLAGPECDACLLTASPGLPLSPVPAAKHAAEAVMLASFFSTEQDEGFGHARHVPHLRGPPAA
jgi:hypothetical protein